MEGLKRKMKAIEKLTNLTDNEITEERLSKFLEPIVDQFFDPIVSGNFFTI